MTRRGIFSLKFCIGMVLAGAALLAAQLTVGALAQNSGPSGVVLEVKGPIGPAVADYFVREIDAANEAGARLVVVEMDTPGGLDDSMRKMIQAIAGSETPVATYVSPTGARAASAGYYILTASHIAAMAPGTNTGAATPVQLGGNPGLPEDASNPFEETATDEEPAASEDEEASADEPGLDETAATEDESSATEADAEATEEDAAETGSALGNQDALRAKAVNDAVAYARSLARLRDRNIEFAESAVRDAASIAAQEALENNVIDVVAESLEDLLVQIDGKIVHVKSGDKTLETAGLQLERIVPDFVTRILAFISNPNVAFIFMSIGMYGIIIEMWNPGSIFPGALGVTSLIIGLYSFQVLPFDWLGVALMAVGALLIVIEAFTPTIGLAGLAGLALFGAGGYLAFPGGIPGYEISLGVIGAMLAFGGVFLGAILVAVIGTRTRGPVIGAEAIKSREGVVDEWDAGENEGHVVVEGERWRARCNQPLSPGQRVKVTTVDGLVLIVKPLR